MIRNIQKRHKNSHEYKIISTCYIRKMKGPNQTKYKTKYF